MKLKNIGTTVINIGNVIILPDESAEINNKAYENNETVNYLIETNRLSLVKEKEKKLAAKTNKKTETPAAEQE